MQTIYRPKGRALEYAPDGLALNIYDSCPHGCSYCFARDMAARFGKRWTGEVKPRPGIVEATRKKLATMQGQGKRIMLCFTCDPYPGGHDSTTTREIILAIKESGNHVQILTKGDETAQRDFDLLDGNDWFGVTWSGAEYGKLEFDHNAEPGAAPHKQRHTNLFIAKNSGISTWLSCEPVFDPASIYTAIGTLDFVDLFRVGKLNYRPSDIDWHAFGHKVRALGEEFGRNIYVKHDLKMEMEMEMEA